jgi:hypothetical protein
MPSRARAYEVGFELGDHGQDVEEQSPDGIGRVVDRPAEVESDLAAGQALGDVACVGQRAREAVEFRDDERVAGAAGGECLAEAGPVAVHAGQAVVDVHALGGHAERRQPVTLGREGLARRWKRARSRSAVRTRLEVCPVCRTLTGHFNGRVLRDTPAPQRC